MVMRKSILTSNARAYKINRKLRRLDLDCSFEEPSSSADPKKRRLLAHAAVQLVHGGKLLETWIVRFGLRETITGDVHRSKNPPKMECHVARECD